MTSDRFFAAMWALIGVVVYIYSFVCAYDAAIDHRWGEASFWMLFIIALNTMKVEKI